MTNADHMKDILKNLLPQLQQIQENDGSNAPTFVWKTINPGHYGCDDEGARGPIPDFAAYHAHVMKTQSDGASLAAADKHRYR